MGLARALLWVLRGVGGVICAAVLLELAAGLALRVAMWVTAVRL